MKLCDMEDYFLDPSTSSASFIANKIAKILEDRFIKICAKNYGQVFATLMLKVVVINLRLYRHFKKSFKLESYLTNLKSHLHRKAFYQFKISAHSLMCEIGRHCNIPYEQRLCRLCARVCARGFV